ncbi:MAG: hypothetical protein IPK32_08970 [Verrucomicrobiaceae bacterium]|nr:hypothetical protein [Verrucomicrobiaceae bacterium]
MPVTSQNWNLRLTAGADVNAANARETASTSSLAANTGSLLLGKDAGQAVPTSNAPGTAALTRLAINPTNNTAISGTPTASNRFQVIRTGTGDIEINAGRDPQFLNQFATIYGWCNRACGDNDFHRRRFCSAKRIRLSPTK